MASCQCPEGSLPLISRGRRLGLVQQALRAAIRGYRYWLSPLFGPRCRFEPSCSVYALDALEKHPLGRALARIVWRVLRCQPWCRGGYDPA